MNAHFSSFSSFARKLAPPLIIIIIIIVMATVSGLGPLEAMQMLKLLLLLLLYVCLHPLPLPLWASISKFVCISRSLCASRTQNSRPISSKPFFFSSSYHLFLKDNQVLERNHEMFTWLGSFGLNIWRCGHSQDVCVIRLLLEPLLVVQLVQNTQCLCCSRAHWSGSRRKSRFTPTSAQFLSYAAFEESWWFLV